MMGGEIDGEFAFFGIEAARRVVARQRARRAFREFNAVRADHRQARFGFAGLGEEHLDVVVKTEARKAFQFRSGQDDADHGPAELFDAHDIERAQRDGVAMAFGSAVRCCGTYRFWHAHAVVFPGILPMGSAVSQSRIGGPDNRASGFFRHAIRRRCVKMREP
ncbi:hypothetical protein D3C86_1514290 [compost metagenome]